MGEAFGQSEDRVLQAHLPARLVEGLLAPAVEAQRLALIELAEGVAHDLKNQLTVVAASVQLARSSADQGRDDLLERAWRSAMRAAQLMDEIVRYSHGDADPGVGAADAAEVLETAVAAVWGYGAKRDVALEMHPGVGVPQVAGSAPALRVLLLHLLRAAVDRCPPESRLVVAAAAEGGGVSIRVRLLDGVDRNPRWPAGAPDRQALLQALAHQAGATLVEDGPWSALQLPAVSRAWEDGSGAGGVGQGFAGEGTVQSGARG